MTRKIFFSYSLHEEIILDYPGINKKYVLLSKKGREGLGKKETGVQEKERTM